MGLRLSPHLEEQIAATVQGLGYGFVGAESISGSPAILRVYVEGPAINSEHANIGLDEITVISRQLSALLDVEATAAGRYRLEVSSPGLDRRLFNLADYQRFVGREVKIRLHRPHEGRKNWTGELVEVDQENVKLKAENQIYTLAFDNIEKAQLVPRF
ncbi:MAG: ribosome maturation factor RimP [Gammaproteobacteria bacterium]